MNDGVRARRYAEAVDRATLPPRLTDSRASSRTRNQTKKEAEWRSESLRLEPAQQAIQVVEFVGGAAAFGGAPL